MDSKNRTRANLKKYIKVAGKWRFVPVLKQNGIPVAGIVLIDGAPLRSTTGTFYLEFRENGRRIQRPVGNSPREAKDAWNLQCNPGDESESIADEEDAGPEVTTVATAFRRFLEEVKATKEEATHLAYQRDLKWVEPRLGPKLVGQITRHDILRVMGEGRAQGLNAKSITRRLIVALMALRNGGAVIELKKGDWLKTTDRTVETYAAEEIRAFFNACTPDQRLLFQTFLSSGFRKRETSTLTWNDVDFRQRTLRVQAKPEYRFKPKNHEERTVPVPAVLIRRLAARRKKQSGSALIFPSPPHPTRPGYGGDKPDAHHLELCKQIAWRAHLNCRRCVTSKGKCLSGPHCRKWDLHKWRHTFATNMLQSGVDIKSLQEQLGHKNIATTEKYLRSLRMESLRSKIEASSIAALLG